MRKFLDVIALLAILTGLILSFVSWLGICTSQCAGTEYYRLLGWKFQTIGMIFFPLLLLTHLFSFRGITALLLSSAVGAEVMFILVQKYTIGKWCPVCLGIAATVGIAAIAYLARYLINLNHDIKQENRGDMMKRITEGVSCFVVMLASFFIVFTGISKINPLEARQDSIKEALIFGKGSSPIELYLFTDWQCPACRKLEPELHQILPAVSKNSRFVFVDYVIHPETLNFIPYNLSFIINNKDKYLEIRDVLTSISSKTGEPSQEEIESQIESLGVEYTPLNYADVVVGRKFFKHVATEFDINATPTLVIVNRDNKKGKKLYGAREITTENVRKAITELKAP